MIRRNLLFLVLFIFPACAVQNEFTVTRPGESAEEALSTYYYTLPQTVVKLSMNVEREFFIPGPYAGFAERFLGIANTGREKRESYDINSVQLKFLKEPDPDTYFRVNLLKGSFAAGDYLKLTSQGFVMDPSGFIRHNGHEEGSYTAPETPYFTDISVTGFFNDVTDTLFKTIVTDTSFLRIPIPRVQREVKTLEQKAQEAANFILEIRRARFELVAGEIEGFPSGEAMGFAVGELNRLEREYLELFTGKRIAESQSRTIFVTPGGKEESIVLFKILENKGLADASSPSGSPVVLKIKPVNKLKNIAPAAISDTPPLNTFFYRIPDMALFQVAKEDKVYYEERATLYQAGKMVNYKAE